MTAIDNFDELTSFKDGEDNKYIVEYILADDGGFCHRCSPFLMAKDIVFEHEYGTYKVDEIRIMTWHVIVYCARIDKEVKTFNILFNIRNKFN